MKGGHHVATFEQPDGIDLSDTHLVRLSLGNLEAFLALHSPDVRKYRRDGATSQFELTTSGKSLHDQLAFESRAVGLAAHRTRIRQSMQEQSMSKALAYPDPDRYCRNSV